MSGVKATKIDLLSPENLKKAHNDPKEESKRWQ